MSYWYSEYRGQDVPFGLNKYFELIVDTVSNPGCMEYVGVSGEYMIILQNANETGENGWSIRRAFIHHCKIKCYKNYLILRNYIYDQELQGRVYELWVDKSELKNI